MKHRVGGLEEKVPGLAGVEGGEPSSAHPTLGRGCGARATLGDVAVGESACVRRVRGDRRTTVRLLEMGLVPGTRVEVRRRAPLGDPLELHVRGYALSIRRSEALGIEVEAVRGPAMVEVPGRVPVTGSSS